MLRLAAEATEAAYFIYFTNASSHPGALDIDFYVSGLQITSNR